MPSHLIQTLVERGIPRVDEENLESLAGAWHHLLLFFSGDPAQFPESDDVAVVLPQLLQAFSGRLHGAVVERVCEHRLRSRFPFDGWPALVLLRDGEYVGSIARMREWAVYLSEIEKLLRSDPPHLPAIEIPVVAMGRQTH
jgi:hydrogenase-1 operon protein HyaE